MAGKPGRSGRKRGSRDLHTRGALEVFRYYEFDPLSKLINEYNELENAEGEKARRDRLGIIRELMKYRHPALSSVEHKGEDGGPLRVTIDYGGK